ncbi:methyltransferase domain-containing protein [Streptomyces ferrugineus]|uniref:Methyltransferase domain-containing protein n=1 Tax=Streptomyces ferrugineus TaxID=1413221 RepID=A0A7M2SWL2_9ACTN|nr:methyltransferase domain-containing protein [Streptomyces ferrugineus]
MPDDLTRAQRDDRPEESLRTRLSRTFDEDAERYDRARPGYPSELYDDLDELAGAGAGSRVLEVGCGTGQATVPLAGRGCRVTAVEAGPRMAAIARRDLAGAAGVEVVTAEFERWPLPEVSYDVVVSATATALHWIDPAVRVAKAADALRATPKHRVHDKAKPVVTTAI